MYETKSLSNSDSAMANIRVIAVLGWGIENNCILVRLVQIVNRRGIMKKSHCKNVVMMPTKLSSSCRMNE